MRKGAAQNEGRHSPQVGDSVLGITITLLPLYLAGSGAVLSGLQPAMFSSWLVPSRFEGGVFIFFRIMQIMQGDVGAVGDLCDAPAHGREKLKWFLADG
jgi:hypothetical protein